MKNKSFEEEKTFNDINYSERINYPVNYNHQNNKSFSLKFLFIFFTLINAIILMTNFSKKEPLNKKLNKNSNIKDDYMMRKSARSQIFSEEIIKYFLKERDRPYFNEINKKRTFEERYPLTKEINCKPHFTPNELIAFLSFLTNETIFFETGSGCSSVIAKYYAKKTYAVEGCKQWYELGIKNGLKDNLIFHDLKPDNQRWSYPGKKSTLEDWKKYFQSYNKSYNADVILIDGRFKLATALDIFDKIKDDTVVFIHEYQHRKQYFVIEEYYQYIYHWDLLTAFVKKRNIKSIPLEIQKKYWYISL